ncbi:MAG: PilZ domain-containing protein [Methylobacter sp.]
MLIYENSSDKQRRRQKRWYGLLPVLVRGHYADGRTFKTHTLVDNISDGGFYLQLPHCLLPCDRIFGLTLLPGGASLAAQGRIVRQEPQDHGLQGAAVCFSNSRLIPASSSH